MYIQLFEPELIALRKEIEFHPELKMILKGQESPDIYVHIAEIAAYCEIVLDGTYSRDDILKLCEIMTQKLFQKRSILIVPMIELPKFDPSKMN